MTPAHATRFLALTRGPSPRGPLVAFLCPFLAREQARACDGAVDVARAAEWRWVAAVAERRSA